MAGFGKGIFVCFILSENCFAINDQFCTFLQSIGTEVEEFGDTVIPLFYLLSSLLFNEPGILGIKNTQHHDASSTTVDSWYSFTKRHTSQTASCCLIWQQNRTVGIWIVHVDSCRFHSSLNVSGALTSFYPHQCWRKIVDRDTGVPFLSSEAGVRVRTRLIFLDNQSGIFL